MVEFALTDTPPDDCDGEFGWDVQMYRGRIARALGLQAVSMRDEHGTTYLVLPGVAIREID